jgi:hypothetical protein
MSQQYDVGIRFLRKQGTFLEHDAEVQGGPTIVCTRNEQL